MQEIPLECMHAQHAARMHSTPHACTARMQHAHALHRRPYASCMCLVTYGTIAAYAYLGLLSLGSRSYDAPQEEGEGLRASQTKVANRIAS